MELPRTTTGRLRTKSLQRPGTGRRGALVPSTWPCWGEVTGTESVKRVDRGQDLDAQGRVAAASQGTAAVFGTVPAAWPAAQHPAALMAPMLSGGLGPREPPFHCAKLQVATVLAVTGAEKMGARRGNRNDSASRTIVYCLRPGWPK